MIAQRSRKHARLMGAAATARLSPAALRKGAPAKLISRISLLISREWARARPRPRPGIKCIFPGKAAYGCFTNSRIGRGEELSHGRLGALARFHHSTNQSLSDTLVGLGAQSIAKCGK